MPVKVYSDSEKRAKIENALEKRYTDRKNWAEIADELDLARSTLSEWRKGPEFREADSKWRRTIRDQTRGDLAQMSEDAVSVIYELMQTDKSGYVRFMAASKILELTEVGSEIEETIADQQKEWGAFLSKQIKQKAVEVKTLEVLPGGGLPPEIVAENEEYKRRMHEAAIIIEAEFTATPPSDTE